MDKIKITGGLKLNGEVEISGSKNSTLPLMAASILANEKCVLHNVPKVQDVTTMGLVLKTLGLQVNRENDHSLVIDHYPKSPKRRWLIALWKCSKRREAHYCQTVEEVLAWRDKWMKGEKA